MATTLTTNVADAAMAPGLVWFVIEGLPALSGSEKQIKWANEIRADALTWMETDFRTVVASILSAGLTLDNANAQAKVAAGKFAANLDSLTSAKWWIDNREALRADVLRTIGRPASDHKHRKTT